MDEECVVDNHTENDDSIEINNEVDSSALSQLDFSCEFTANIPQILKSLNISLAFTSYQAGRLMIVRSDGENLDVNYKSFQRPMGLSVSETGLTLGVFNQVINFHRVDGLVNKLKTPLQKIEDDITAPKVKSKTSDGTENGLAAEGANAKIDVFETDKTDLSEEELALRVKNEEALKAYQEKLHEPVDDRVDSCFITRSSHYTGMINLHDIDWGDEGLWVVNSSFSCLCTLDPDHSFVPRWKPHFISDLVPEDRCHLNGMGLKDGKPAYVTTFSTYDKVGQWRMGEKSVGTLMDVESNEILLDGLNMPHSPRWYKDRVYYCNSGLGQFCSYNPSTGQQKILAEFQGFTRGVDFHGPIAFVCSSKVRMSDVLNTAPISKKFDQTYSGIWLINLTDNSVIGHLKFTGNVDQIYDIAVISGGCFPELLEPTHPRMRNHFCIP